MSTDHQRYSTENQADAISAYAAQRSFDIVRTYADEGRSGLNIAGRESLKMLLDDVRNGRADFDAILVYDISRWGRFQDADESGYYEFVCREAGIAVHYCAEPFENDGSPSSTIMKSVRRVMAGEFSRDLSTKVFAGQCRLVSLGYRQGGPAGYGLRRRLIDEKGHTKAELRPGEQKSLQTDRVVLVPGPEEEVEMVRRIYHFFVEERRSEREIAAMFNAKGWKTNLGRPWTRSVVHQILSNEKYVGNNVYNRISFKLKKKRVVNPPDMWIRADGAFEAIVNPASFHAAACILEERARRFSDNDMLRMLSDLLASRGLLSGLIIDEIEEMPSAASYRHRFGSLLRAYQLVGYAPDRDYRFIETNRHLRLLHPEIVSEVTRGIEDTGGAVGIDPTTDLLTVHGELTVSIVVVRCHSTRAGTLRWKLRLDTGLRPDLTIAVRLDADNQRPRDFYILPWIDVGSMETLRMAELNGLRLDAYRVDDLSPLYHLLRRSPTPRAA
ncbi:recombinase family protein [Methylobacterium radiodurans]|uniref:Recombinase family protein n=2 Tax=Methylobacterium radiodurans TaxID=2202828 RepID=A0A2U8VS49_9HYPH|nr:recombinase family protein [Methylobacterium radiodurans]